MKKATLRYVVDALLWTCLVGMVSIGAVLGLVIPSGPVGESSKYFLSLHRHQWGAIHAYLSVAFVVLMAVHIILNLKWIAGMTAQIFKRKAAPLLAAGILAPALVLLVFWLVTPRDASLYEGFGSEPPGRGRMRQVAAAEPVTRADTPFLDREQPAESSAAEPRAVAEPQAGSERAVPPTETLHENGDHWKAGAVVITGQQTLRDIERATGLSARVLADRLGLPPSAPLNETLGRLRRIYGIEIQAVRDLVEKMLKD